MRLYIMQADSPGDHGEIIGVFDSLDMAMGPDVGPSALVPRWEQDSVISPCSWVWTPPDGRLLRLTEYHIFDGDETRELFDRLIPELTREAAFDRYQMEHEEARREDFRAGWESCAAQRKVRTP